MRRGLIGLLVGALALALAAPGASAATPRPEDAVGDVSQAKGDIVAGTYSASFTDIFLTSFKAKVTLRTGTDPEVAPAWLNAATGLTVQLDTDSGHTGPERSVRLHSIDDGGAVFVGEVTDTTTTPASAVWCSATATFTAPNIYKVILSSDCLPAEQTQLRARFRMRWDQPPAGGTVTLDRSPETGWGSLLVAPPPP